jgi:hypothetical protein
MLKEHYGFRPMYLHFFIWWWESCVRFFKVDKKRDSPSQYRLAQISSKLLQLPQIFQGRQKLGIQF